MRKGTKSGGRGGDRERGRGRGRGRGGGGDGTRRAEIKIRAGSTTMTRVIIVKYLVTFITRPDGGACNFFERMLVVFRGITTTTKIEILAFIAPKTVDGGGFGVVVF